MFRYGAADLRATLEPQLHQQSLQEQLMLHPMLRLPQQLGNHWCKKEADMLRFCKFRQPEYLCFIVCGAVQINVQLHTHSFLLLQLVLLSSILTQYLPRLHSFYIAALH